MQTKGKWSQKKKSLKVERFEVQESARKNLNVNEVLQDVLLFQLSGKRFRVLRTTKGFYV